MIRTTKHENQDKLKSTQFLKSHKFIKEAKETQIPVPETQDPMQISKSSSRSSKKQI